MTIGNYLYRLRCGDRAVDFQNGPLAAGFMLANGLRGLQAGALSVQYEAGSGVLPSLQRIGSTRAPAQLRFVTHLDEPSGVGALMRSIRDVERFVTEVWLHHEEGARAPVYLERRLDEGYSGTGDEVVLFGRGATYYRVLSIDSISFPDARHVDLATGWIPNAEFALTCDPCPVGKPQFCAEATGWVRFDGDGNIQLWRGGTNLIHNPSFEHATFGTDWTVEDADLTVSNLKRQEVNREGEELEGRARRGDGGAGAGGDEAGAGRSGGGCGQLRDEALQRRTGRRHASSQARLGARGVRPGREGDTGRRGKRAASEAGRHGVCPAGGGAPVQERGAARLPHVVPGPDEGGVSRLSLSPSGPGPSPGTRPTPGASVRRGPGSAGGGSTGP